MEAVPSFLAALDAFHLWVDLFTGRFLYEPRWGLGWKDLGYILERKRNGRTTLRSFYICAVAEIHDS